MLEAIPFSSQTERNLCESEHIARFHLTAPNQKNYTSCMFNAFFYCAENLYIATKLNDSWKWARRMTDVAIGWEQKREREDGFRRSLIPVPVDRRTVILRPCGADEMRRSVLHSALLTWEQIQTLFRVFAMQSKQVCDTWREAAISFLFISMTAAHLEAHDLLAAICVHGHSHLIYSSSLPKLTSA